VVAIKFAAAASTVKRNNTTQATGGTALTELSDVWNIMAGFLTRRAKRAK
jgi:hypothetical protein